MKRTDCLGIMMLILSSFLTLLEGQAQVVWDGEAGDSLWQNPINWVGNMAPIPGDEVVFDHSIVQDGYTVIIGDISQVEVRSILIETAEKDSITLQLPEYNTQSPALTVTGPGYGIYIKDKGIFINASGAESGIPLVIADSLRIDNGGRYIHRSTRSHAALVTRLSRAPGTEMGVFEFDIPDASTTISLSDRVYGSLVLSSTSAGGNINYTGSGTKPIVIRSDFQINPGVKLRLNFSDTLFITHNLLQHGGAFNLSTGSRILVVAVGHDIIQDSGQIAESGNVHPLILLNGTTPQSIDMKGTIDDEVGMAIDNQSVELKSPLQLPYGLFLKEGKIITGDEALLTIGEQGFIEIDSTSDISFIEGPVQKLGLADQYFLFPVGAGGQLRWIALYHITGNVTVEFKQEDPNLINPVIAGVDHISSLEYWKINMEGSLNSPVQAELSFHDANGSGVTDLSSLCVANLLESGWENAGNTATSGSAGSAGSVTSDSFVPVSSGINLFTLGSMASSENPLPLTFIEFTGSRTGDYVYFRWNIAGNLKPLLFELEGSGDGKEFTLIRSYPYEPGRNKYSHRRDDGSTSQRFYKLRIRFSQGFIRESNTIVIPGTYYSSTGMETVSFIPPNLYIHLHSLRKQKMKLYMADQTGNIVAFFDMIIPAGNSTKEIRLNCMAAGLYHIFGLSSTGRISPIQFFLHY